MGLLDALLLLRSFSEPAAATLFAKHQNAHARVHQRQNCDDFHRKLIHEFVVIRKRRDFEKS
jgi:hypothetical protein